MSSRLTVTCTGDISLHTHDDADPFAYVKEHLSRGGIVFGNLETVLTERSASIPKAVALRTSPARAQYLADAGFHVVNLANNHTLDYGPDGFRDTIESLRRHKVEYCGTWEPAGHPRLAIIRREDTRVGFIGFMAGPRNPHIQSLSLEEIVPYVAWAAPQVDILAVSVHWGEEYVFYPSPHQQKIARAIIDAGAKLVIGHHPHVVQGIEHYRSGCILYSVGNFQFNIPALRREFPESAYTMLTHIHIGTHGPCAADTVPLFINDNGQPAEMTEPGKSHFQHFIREISGLVSRGAVTNLAWHREAAAVYFRNHVPSFHRLIRTYGFRYVLRYLRWQVSRYVLMMRLGAATKLVAQSTLSKPAEELFRGSGKTAAR